MTDHKNSQKLPNWQEFQNGLVAKAMKDEIFRKELLSNSKAVLEMEMAKLKEGAKLPANLEVKVIEQQANTLYLVLPAIAGELSDDALAIVAGGSDPRIGANPGMVIRAEFDQSRFRV